MFGGEVKHHFATQRTRICGRQIVVKRTVLMRVKIVLNQINILYISIISCNYVMNKICIVSLRALLTRLSVAQTLIHIIRQ